MLLDFLLQCTSMRQTITTYRKGFTMSTKFNEVHKQYNAYAFDAQAHTHTPLLFSPTCLQYTLGK